MYVAASWGSLLGWSVLLVGRKVSGRSSINGSFLNYLCQPTTVIYNASGRPCYTAIECNSCVLVGLFEGRTGKLLAGSQIVQIKIGGKELISRKVSGRSSINGFFLNYLCQPTTVIYNASGRPCYTAIECNSCVLVGLFEGRTGKLLAGSQIVQIKICGKELFQELVREMEVLNHGLLTSINLSKYQLWKLLQETSRLLWNCIVLFSCDPVIILKFWFQVLIPSKLQSK